MEAIGRVRHKNLVRLLGYCVEGAYRYRIINEFQFLLLVRIKHEDLTHFSLLICACM